MESKKLTDVERVFKYFDKDNSGYLEINELGDALRCVGLNPSKAQIDNLIKESDTNSDKKLNIEEFKDMYARVEVSASITLEDLIKEFKEFDKNNSGNFDIRELEEILTSQGESMSRDEIKELLGDFDKNHDGTVDIAELAAGLLGR